MTWAWLTIASGILNAIWSSQIKSRVQKEGALTFAASIRWGVGLSLLPFALAGWKQLSVQWWALSALAGTLECVSLWAISRGARRDYYSTYALSNTVPLFSTFWASIFLKETIGPALGLGVVLIVIGTLWLYYRGHWSWWGMAAAFIGSFSGLFSKWAMPESGFLPHACFAFLIGALVLTAGGLKAGSTSGKAIVRNIWVNWYLIILSSASTVVYYWALEIAPLSRVSPLVRINLVVGFILSYFWLGEKQGWKSRGFGAALLLCGLILVLWKP